MNMDTLTRFFTIASSLSVASVAAYFSVVGLAQIFPENIHGIVTMAIVLEIAKIAAVVWIHRSWHLIARWLKFYLVGAIGVLMAITSMGIFGYLANSHLHHQEQIELNAIDTGQMQETIKRKNEALNRLNEAMASLDNAFNKSVEEGFVTRALKQRQDTQTERKAISDSIFAIEKELIEDRAKLSNAMKQRAGAERKIGPLRYLVDLFGGEEHDDASAAKWLILAVVLVFDPLAIVLLLAALPPSQTTNEKAEPSNEPVVGMNMAAQPKDDDLTPLEKDEASSIVRGGGGVPIENHEGPDKDFYNLSDKPEKKSLDIWKEKKTMSPDPQT